MVQKVLDYAEPESVLMDEVVEIMANGLLELVEDNHGNHVIQKVY